MGVSRINKAFKNLKLQNKKAIIPYIMAGDKGMEFTEKLVYTLEKLGATVIEIGVPFSDPVADGPTIQAAGKRALEKGVNIKQILDLVKKIRNNSSIPIVLMTYLNPVLQYGVEEFCNKCKEVQLDGLIIPDLPLEELEIVEPFAKKAELAIIPLVTLTSGKERIEVICRRGEGFIYTVTVTGVTGARKEMDSDLTKLLKEVKSISKLPVVAGFGISTNEQIKEITKYVDGVVVGSKIVDLAYREDFNGIAELMGN
ncbi:tryptophan synthase alpha chain [Clostridium acetireducens DSM 10703]|jgi:tryptophan synthase alpha chain|uniref:Tryptophan synthase alpha chain n=1 Tax=Clostridium acetireducens DSM 10703 TaxID=1121290 RepID=A0A1E8EYQ9_9CLOT|nr:tryptophan synthase subunit alpha [Clostridium acetireducens]OFI06089.1 tryptophan synthase alpha chain [Clostridium acetireducens DSM 10703]